MGVQVNLSLYCTYILYIDDIYFFEVNTKYISSNVLKISVISRVRSTSEIADIFKTWYILNKSKFSFYFFSLREKTELFS